MFEQIKLYISNKWEKLYPLLFSSMICLLLYFFKDNEIIDKCYYKCFVTEFTEAIEELATHLADFSCNEQDYSVLLRYFSFGLHRLKSYRVRFEQEKNALLAFN